MGSLGKVLGTVGGFLVGGPQGAMLGASLGAGFDSEKSQENTNAQNVALTREQMAFQERMSSTAYQRATADMKAAGLNPMLAYAQGGATTPGGSSVKLENSAAAGAQSAQAVMSTLGGATQAAQSAASAEMLSAQAAKLRSETLENSLHTARMLAQTKLMEADYSLRDAQTKTEKRRPFAVDAQEARDLAQAKLLERQEGIAHIEETLRGDTFSADVARRKALSTLAVDAIPRAKAEAEFYSTLGQANPYLRMIFETLKGAGSARSIFLGGK